MKIFITGNIKKENFYIILDKIISITKTYGHDLFLNSSFDSCDKDVFPISFGEFLDSDFDLIFSIGGDGSLLSSIRSMGKKQIPIMGIHIGNLGFLNQINHINLESNLISFYKKHKISYNDFKY